MTNNYINIKDFGAVGDGSTIDHPAVQKAIDHCLNQGGGVVVCPPGTYLCGTVKLKSNAKI